MKMKIKMKVRMKVEMKQNSKIVHREIHLKNLTLKNFKCIRWLLRVNRITLFPMSAL